MHLKCRTELYRVIVVEIATLTTPNEWLARSPLRNRVYKNACCVKGSR
jgi:hypothetical protein